MNSTAKLKTVSDLRSDLGAVGTTTSTMIERTTVRTGLTYPALIEAFERELGHWEAAIGDRLAAKKAPWSEVEEEVTRMAGPRGFLIMYKVDQGVITSLSGVVKRCSLYLVGNPVIADQILAIDPRGGLYVPFRVCLFDSDKGDGAFLIYDRPSSFLAALAHPELREIGTRLDGKIDGVARALAARTGNQGVIR